MKKTLLSIVAAVATTFSMNAQIQNYSVGQTVADFTVTDVHGNTHTLSSITGAGKWVVLDFFFTTCPPCQATVPYFSELHEKYGCNAGDLYCLSVDVGDSDADVLAFEATYSTQGGFSPAPAASGTEGGGDAVVADFGPAAYPTYALIGPDMKLKNGDIWPVGSVSDFENAFSAAGFTPAVMSCSSAGLEEMTINNLSVYPNPSANQTTISMNLDASAEVVAEVYNAVGSLVASSTYAGAAGMNKFDLNTSELANGQYILRVSSENTISNQLNISILK